MSKSGFKKFKQGYDRDDTDWYRKKKTPRHRYSKESEAIYSEEDPEKQQKNDANLYLHR